MPIATLKKLLAALAIVGMLASGIGIASFVIFANHDQQDMVAPVRTPPTPPAPSVPTVKEFLIGVTVTAQACDPAGARCLYTYTIDPKYVGLHPFPEAPFTVEYEVAGGNAPQPGRFTVTGDQAEILKDVTVEGPPGATLSATVVRVFEVPPAPVGEPPPPPPGAPVEPAPAP